MRSIGEEWATVLDVVSVENEICLKIHKNIHKWIVESQNREKIVGEVNLLCKLLTRNGRQNVSHRQIY